LKKINLSLELKKISKTYLIIKNLIKSIKKINELIERRSKNSSALIPSLLRDPLKTLDPM
jgi:hypothetical protein